MWIGEGYTLNTNPWGKGNLVNGVDYTQSISFDPTTFPNGIDFSWSWPAYSTGAIYAYPEIKYVPPAPAQIDNLTNLSVAYSTTMIGNTNNYDVALDLWLTSTPYGTPGNIVQDELMIFFHNPPQWDFVAGQWAGNQPYTITSPGLSGAHVNIEPGHGATSTSPGWTLISVENPTDILSGTLSISDVMNTLIAHGALTGHEYLSDVQLGAETAGGTGGFNLNNLSYNWNVATTSGTPNAPVISSFSPDSGKVGDGITNATVLTLTGTAEANSTVMVFDGSTKLGTATVNGSGAWNFSTPKLADGIHSLTATDTDILGNASVASAALDVTVDTTAPTPTFTNLVHNSHGTVTLSGTSEAHSVLSIYEDANTTALGTVTPDANGVLYDSASHATIQMGPANDLVTALGGGDTFVFAPQFGKDIITDFRSGGENHDILQFDHNTFSNVADVLAHSAQVGLDVVITADVTDSVTLHNVQLTHLHSNDFHIV
jgi:hypothetical protein